MVGKFVLFCWPVLYPGKFINCGQVRSSPMDHNNSIQNTKKQNKTKQNKKPLQPLFLMSHVPVQYIRLVSILQRSVFSVGQLAHPYVTTGKTIALIRRPLLAK